MARSNPEVLAALKAKLGDVSNSAITQRRDRLRELVDMPVDIATYVVAKRAGVKISKYLDGETLRDVAEFEARVAEKEGQAEGKTSPKRTGAKAGAQAPRATKVSISAEVDTDIPALSPAHAKEAKRMAERVYPKVYVFENSVRDFIERILKDKHGPTWWASAVPTRVQKTAEENKAKENDSLWHGARGAREINYVYLIDLWRILEHGWPDFKTFFPNKAFAENLITNDMNVSRNVIAHMNPLGEDDVKNIEAAYGRWAKQLNAVKDKIP